MTTKIIDLYKLRESQPTKIKSDDIEDFKEGLTIHKIEVVGDDRKGVLLTFKETQLKHKCNREDVIGMGIKFKVQTIDEFVGKKINLYETEKGMVRIDTPLRKKKKEEKKAK